MQEGYSLGRRMEEWGEDTYEGRSRAEGRRVAIRVLNYVGMGSKEKHQVVNEVNILKELQHNNIVRCRGHHIDKQKGHLYIVTDPCDYGSLAHFLRNTPLPLSEPLVWDLFTDVVLALHYIHNEHSQPILHRNISLTSIFLHNNPLPSSPTALQPSTALQHSTHHHYTAKLGNFALVRKLQEGEQFSHTQLLHSAYLSPEQMQGGLFTKKTDIWAMGCLLYELCAGQKAFEGKNEFETAKLVRDSRVADTAYSREMNRVIQWCLEKNAQSRPSISDLQGVPQVNLRIRQKRFSKQTDLVRRREEAILAKQEQLSELERGFEEQRLLSASKMEVPDSKPLPYALQPHFNNPGLCSRTCDNSHSSRRIKPNLKKDITIQSQVTKKLSLEYQAETNYSKRHTARNYFVS